MIERNGDAYVLICDICGDGEVPTVFEDFQEAVEYKKENGWKNEKYRGEWQDICPECQEV